MPWKRDAKALREDLVKLGAVIREEDSGQYVRLTKGIHLIQKVNEKANWTHNEKINLLMKEHFL